MQVDLAAARKKMDAAAAEAEAARGELAEARQRIVTAEVSFAG